MSVPERLAFLRKRAKLRSKRAAADAYGIGYEVYKKIDSETSSDPRNLTSEQARDIARFHKVSAGWVMFGEGTPEGFNNVSLLGKIGAGQEMMMFENVENGETISTEIGNPDGGAFEIDGDSMLPLAHHRDWVFVGPPRRDIESLVGLECAVLLDDGRRFFKIIANGTKKGRYDLLSYNAEPIRDVAIHSAGPFLGLKRNLHSSKRRR